MRRPKNTESADTGHPELSHENGSPEGVVRRGGTEIRWRVVDHPEWERAPVPFCITEKALEELLFTVGNSPPESGAKGFGPKDRMGIDLVEFDVWGSKAAGGAVYSPDTEWGNARLRYHMDKPEDEVRLWTADLHSHPGGHGAPSSKVGVGLGDLGYAEEVFKQNSPMRYFMMPILTGTGNGGEVEIHPWICVRGQPPILMRADFRVCDVDEFPERVFNPDWLGVDVGADQDPAELAEEPAEAEVTHVPPPALVQEPAVRHVLVGPKLVPQPFDVAVFSSLCSECEVTANFFAAALCLAVKDHQVELFVELQPEFPLVAPGITIKLEDAYYRFGPVRWAGFVVDGAEQRLARLCRWLLTGLSDDF